MTWYGVQSIGEDAPEETLYMEADNPLSRPTRLAGERTKWAMRYIERANAHPKLIASRYGHDTDLVKIDFEPDDPTIVPPAAAMPRRKMSARKQRAAELKKRLGSGTEMSASGVISKTDDEQQLVFGWAYVTHDTEGNVVVDKSGDFVDDYNEIEKSAYNFVLKSRRGDALHSTTPTSTIVESVVFTPEKIEKMGIPKGSVPTGWWVGFKIEDDEVWDRVKKGELAAFSVYGSNEEGAAPLR